MVDPGAARNRRPRLLIGAVSLLLATAVWLGVVHLFFRPRLEDFRRPAGVAPQAQALAARHLHLWEDPQRRTIEINRMRLSNAEWDFMGRTYLVLALANMALREPQQEARYLSVIDAIIDETLKLEASEGMYFFLMDYARRQPFVAQPARSTFVDGEIAMMLAARQIVQPLPRYAPLLKERIDTVVQSMAQGPVLCGESYPDECWMFCNALAAAAIVISDRCDGRDHSEFIRRWLASVKARLVDPTSGLIVSSFTYDGKHLDGPEGSSLWMIAHCLQPVDPQFARQQYERARQQIGRQVAGFGFAEEWPPSWQGPMDVDSGPIVPVVGASAGSSGLAVLGAAAFDDDPWLGALLTTLRFAAFPIRHDDELRFAASNQVGDAVLTYAMVMGPLWERAARPVESNEAQP
jgi:hypothetical protein